MEIETELNMPTGFHTLFNANLFQSRRTWISAELCHVWLEMLQRVGEAPMQSVKLGPVKSTEI